MPSGRLAARAGEKSADPLLFGYQVTTEMKSGGHLRMREQPNECSLL